MKNRGQYCEMDHDRGLDHGAWVPLMFPEAEVPVLQLSIQQYMDPEKHYAIGKAIEPLRHEGILILGSGGAVHPLGYAPLRPGAITDSWVHDFEFWLTKSVNEEDYSAILNYVVVAAYPERAHPYPDHFMPLITTLGAAEKLLRGM
jgi:4,5-DOPA dioxygenase extradiol